ncbi:MAG TPA: transcriptional repressor LexA [Candidatus Limnocylindria bacterium]|nr:transcriptional repressor LexA [Candidatus Limnocylindria bacterium]
MREMTGRQRDILEFIKSFSSKHGVPPTVREIGEQFKVTPRAAFDHLKALERKGELQRRVSAGRTSRSLTVTGGGAGPRYRLPILGRIAAGQPVLAVENREGEIEIAPASLPGRGEDLFALRVRGDSMIDAHICDGDLVLVRRQDGAQVNDIVVAMVGGGDDAEATVKRYQRDGERVVLKPEHPTMAPIVIDPRRREFKIVGKVVGLLRGF